MGADGETAEATVTDETLERLRSFCAMLPETAEIDGLGHPTFRVATRSFAVYERVEGRPTVCVKLALEDQARLVERDGIEPEPDTGHHGWTRLAAGGGIDWPEIDRLVVASYRMVAPPEYVVMLDALLGER